MSTKGNLKRLQVLVVSVPIFVGTSYVLYKRMILGEEPRTFEQAGPGGRLLDRPVPLREVVQTVEGKANPNTRPS